MRRYVLAACLSLAASSVLAQTAVPHTFTAGTAAKASEVNANFSALVDAIVALEAKVATLQGSLTVNAVAGEYRLLKYGQFYFGVNGESYFCHAVAGDSTITLNADGTFDMSYEELETCGGSAGGHRPQPSDGPGAGQGTWELAGSSLSIASRDDGLAVFEHGAGGRFFIEVLASDSTIDDDGVTRATRDFQVLMLVRK